MRQVAKETAHRFNPHVKIEAYHANIMDAQFNVEWFKSFEIVFNALDNIAARSHVNKMCIAADVPLVESGTTGFQGQVQIIKKVRMLRIKANKRRLINRRESLDVTIAFPKKPRRASQSAPSEAHRASRFTA